jgi:dTDP-4-dehydrorhamnose 3,5-epimerase
VKRPQIVRMPRHYWRGFKNIGDEKAIVMYFANRLYDDANANPDEERIPLNNNTSIDKRTGQVFDWNHPPHK